MGILCASGERKNLRIQIWGGKDRGLKPDVRAGKEEILIPVSYPGY
jgi:hypothetical protein